MVVNGKYCVFLAYVRASASFAAGEDYYDKGKEVAGEAGRSAKEFAKHAQAAVHEAKG